MINDNERFYQLALTFIPNIGSVQARNLVEHFGSAAAIFKAKQKELSHCEQIGNVRAKSITSFLDFSLVEQELQFIDKYSIQFLFFTDTAYPKRLLHCYDAPILLYYKGNADLNTSKLITIIGTRNNTDYGKQITEKLIDDLKVYNVTIVSGLAYGIDAIAHKAALRNKLPTVGILAHGLDKIYPAQHKSLAKEMIEQGGLLSEFPKGTLPDKHNFPKRNRIAAGLSDATIVVETAIKGGSMITAELANNYNRDVFAFPGKTTDIKSSGCNYLIKNNKAILLTDTEQLIEMMGWQTKKQKIKSQRDLFVELSEDERKIVSLLQQHESIHIDELYIKTGLNSSAVAACILNLELQQIIIALPGKMYKIT